MNIIIAILIFSLIIIIHELGHFLLAKKNGIGVTEFSLGMGPRLISFVKNDTRYSLKVFPLGGSCMMLGEDELVEDERAFNKKPVWARISVIAAGPIFNFILAYVLAMIIVGAIGYDVPKLYDVQKNSPAMEAGLQKGDIITKLDNTKISIAREISSYMYFNANGAPIKVTYQRDGKVNTVTLTPKLQKNGKYLMGVYAASNVREKTSAVGVFKYSAVEVKYWIVTTVKSVGKLITGKVGMNEMAGPVGVVSMIGDTYQSSISHGIFITLMSLANLCILLSANLGVMNLLPIPALDGGRLVFLFLEVLRGKPIDKEKEGMVHMIGFIALMLLMVFVMYNDISRLFTK
ncbi:RIP metalloprotease RseP [Anaeromicropila herbilytica]|uniref:Zinc metalloprotease n=1 Tax=Anaeromicropila herbilytica TaxID=2785025 RepID=A0A7R7EM98_9FIRM|nr:RIP metalloprotease RseP [Anaeromicropila herbilytica]BCN31481.1 zinc metalloprotease [Anaeromicropila herbilytica]